MANQEISLKWIGYQNNILCNVKELFKDEGLSDVTLISDGQSFRAHKVILSANSAVFRNIFQQNPHKDPIIVLHDINTASLRTLLTFMYNGEVNVTEEFLPVLLKAAETLRICGLSTGNNGSRDAEPNNPMENQTPKKRKKSEQEDNNNKCRKIVQNTQQDTTKCTQEHVANLVPKVEPLDSPLSDYSTENTDDTDLTDIALIDDNLQQKHSIRINETRDKFMNNDVKKLVNVDGLSTDKNSSDDDKDSVEIDKEVETVLQSGTIVESLSITSETSATSNEANNTKDKSNAYYANPSFPCPFCPRVYNGWGYRRRHVKSRHTVNRLSCKWCVAVLPSTGAWYSHATRIHGVPHEEARNSLVVMVEAHAVLTLNEPSVAQLLGQAGLSEAQQVCDKSN